jgi:hypothetical protein
MDDVGTLATERNHPRVATCDRALERLIDEVIATNEAATSP